MLTTGVAFSFVLRGKIQQHRQWMARSFAVGPLVFLSARAILEITGLERLGPATVETVVWVCLASAILLADIALYWQDLWSARIPVPKTRTAVM
jgi:uncharacterized membrane protein YozB (DUF420 family)